MIIVLTTVASAKEAGELGHELVSRRLAACVQILPQMTSIYLWQGKIQKEPEHILLIKTLSEKFDELREFITANHSYDVPEIVAIDSTLISEPYLNWLTEALK